MKFQTVGESFSQNSLFFEKASKEFSEILVFGCGYGESILIKSDSGKFIVVDSFLNYETGNPIVIDYLNNIGEPLDSIKCVIVTHFHDDHIQGITKILEESNGASLVVNPIIFRSKKILNYIAKTRTICGNQNRTTKEINKLITFVENNEVNFVYALSNRIIFSDENSEMFTLEALSPHDESLDKYILQIDSGNWDVAKDLSYLENLMSVVLLVNTNNSTILLGGDCVKKEKSSEGWETICDEYLKRTKAYRFKADTFKIPHHGSETGQCELVWKTMLGTNPLAVLTTFNKGRKVPNESEIKWILDRTNELYIVGNIKKNNDLSRQLRKAGAPEDNEVYFNRGTTGGLKCVYMDKCNKKYVFAGYVEKVTNS